MLSIPFAASHHNKPAGSMPAGCNLWRLKEAGNHNSIYLADLMTFIGVRTWLTE